MECNLFFSVHNIIIQLFMSKSYSKIFPRILHLVQIVRFYVEKRAFVFPCLQFLTCIFMYRIFIDTFITAGGARLCTYSGGKVYDIYLCSCAFSYIPGKNKFYEAGGRMDEYYDNIFTIKNGSFKRIYSGTYGIPVNSEVQFDENSDPIYEYYWEETKVDSADEYNEKLNSVYDLFKSVEPTKFYHYDTIYDEIYSY